MIELTNDELVISFPEVHENAQLRIALKRTLRIPDDDKTYPLPPGLGNFPLQHVDDHADRVPKSWLKHGGVMLPMYQSESMWVNFDSWYSCPMAVKIATGKINAVSGQSWKDKLNRNPQDYVVATKQRWLDGYCVEKGVIRQFVAMPLGAGVTAEEQVTGKAEHGGLQIIAYPMKREAYDRYFPPVKQPKCSSPSQQQPLFSRGAAMGMAPGGRMKQEIYEDPYKMEDWDLEHSSRVFVHICNSMVWHDLTGKWPPTVPPTARKYTKAGLPWFDYYDDKLRSLKGSAVLNKLKSIAQFGKKKSPLLPENEPVKPENVINLRPGLKPGRVREWIG